MGNNGEGEQLIQVLWTITNQIVLHGFAISVLLIGLLALLIWVWHTNQTNQSRFARLEAEILELRGGQPSKSVLRRVA